MSLLEPDQRVLLKASLDNLVKGSNVSENVQNCEHVLRNFATRADRVLRHEKTRGKTYYLDEQLTYEDLDNVGGYVCNKIFNERRKIISFLKNRKKLEFIFEKTRGKTDAILDLATSGGEYSSDELNKMGVKDFARGALEGTIANANEFLIGNEARSLQGYTLHFVNRYSFVKSKFLGFIPFSKEVKEEIYCLER
jgi:hypothetical protein